MNRLTSGTFYDAAAANRAIDALMALGYPQRDINIIMSGEIQRRFSHGSAPGERQGANVAKGAAAGGVVGGTIGAIVASVAATGALTPTVATAGIAAPLFVAGPAAMALDGGGAGVAAGSVLGALVGLGVPRDDAEKVEHDIDAGGIVVSLNSRDEDRSEVLQAPSANYARNVVESAGVR
jgi:hypothetical protein